MATLNMGIRRPRVQLGPVVRFGTGYPLLKEDDKVIQCREWTQYRDNVTHDNNLYDVQNAHHDQSTCDTVKVDKAGQIILEDERNGQRKYAMYESAFYQLLNTLQIPISFAQRVQPAALADLITSMLDQQFTRQCFIKTYAGVAATSFTFRTADRPLHLSAFRLFENINTKSTKQECKVDFSFCLRQGFNNVLAMTYTDYRGESKDVKGAVEILVSDSMDTRPFVVGMVMTPKSHALIRDLAFPVETNDATKAMNMVETFITRIGSEIDKWAKLYANLEKVKVTDELATKIRARASKSLKHPLEVKVGNNLLQQYEALKPLRQNTKNTIMGKRDVAFFAGFLLDLAKQ